MKEYRSMTKVYERSLCMHAYIYMCTLTWFGVL